MIVDGIRWRRCRSCCSDLDVLLREVPPAPQSLSPARKHDVSRFFLFYIVNLTLPDFFLAFFAVNNDGDVRLANIGPITRETDGDAAS